MKVWYKKAAQIPPPPRSYGLEASTFLFVSFSKSVYTFPPVYAKKSNKNTLQIWPILIANCYTFHIVLNELTVVMLCVLIV